MLQQNYFQICTEKTILLRSKILLDTDLKLILLNHQNNSVTLKMMNNTANKFDVILETNLSVLHNYLDSSTKLFFLSVFS